MRESEDGPAQHKSTLQIKATTDDDTCEENELNGVPPLRNFYLRRNQLSGNILIGNYKCLTHLEVNENEMDVLDLSSLLQLEVLKCTHNKINELAIYGRNLRSLIANNNTLHTITVSRVPNRLNCVDISRNAFTQLPLWLATSKELHTLNADHNQLQTVHDFLTHLQLTGLRVLRLAYNCLRSIDYLPDGLKSLEQLYLQSNELQYLPDQLGEFINGNLRLLNVSCNKLSKLGCCGSRSRSSPGALTQSPIEEVYLTNNHFTETVLECFQHATMLRVLHAAYNKISFVPEHCLKHWLNLEILLLSGNMLQCLPESLQLLQKLRVLRVHSNVLLTMPNIKEMSQLVMVDLAHNHLDRLNLVSVVPQSLKYLDVSGNQQLRFDADEIKACQSQRNWSLVDVSGTNRQALPVLKKSHPANAAQQPAKELAGKQPWALGFSETPGVCRRLTISQLRLPAFQMDEALFGMFEGGQSPRNGCGVTSFPVLVPVILQQERAVKENASGEYLKYTLLTTHKKLISEGNYQGLVNKGCVLCHVAKECNAPAATATAAASRSFGRSAPSTAKRYVLRVVSLGDIAAYLIRRTSNVCLTLRQPLGGAGQQESANIGQLPDPEMVEVPLRNGDEYLVVCNANVWNVMDVDRVAREIRKEENVVLAAKRIQDIAQSFGAHENVSVIVVRFRNVGTDVDHLIKELKQTVRKIPITGATPSFGLHNGGGAVAPASLVAAHMALQRSSPCGQSDKILNCQKDTHVGEYVIAHARVLEEETEMETLDDADSVLSEEQFKCWEYMLEQNTQLLFDKELNTISKAYSKHQNGERRKVAATAVDWQPDHKASLFKNIQNKFISISTPQLMYTEAKKPLLAAGLVAAPAGGAPAAGDLEFLSQSFGSNRSFQPPLPTAAARSVGLQFAASGHIHPKLGGGPNAAYFGSLQRLMPCGTDYDYALTQERRSSTPGVEEEDCLESDTRMHKYWGVATTEL